MAALAELAKALQVLEKFQDLQEENERLQKKNKELAAQLETEKPAAQDKSKRTVAQGGKPKKPTAQGELSVPRVSTYCRILLNEKQFLKTLKKLGIPVHRVKRLLGAAEGSWLIFLDVRADFTKGTPNAEWLTAVCNGGRENEENHRKDEELDWTFRFDWFKGDKEHAELWQNGTFPKEAPASKEQASKEQTSEAPVAKEPASKEQTSEEPASKEQDVNALVASDKLVASGKWGDAEECAEECAEK